MKEEEEEYRIKEVVGLGEFYIQKKNIYKHKIDNPGKFMKFLINQGLINNEERFEWLSLNLIGDFSSAYYAKKFTTLEEAQNKLDQIKEKSLVKTYS